MEQVAEFIAANEAFERAKAKLAAVTETIKKYGQDLRERPKDAFFENGSIAPPRKSGVHVMYEGKSWDAATWPSADEINQTLLDYVQTEQRVKSVWDSMPANLRAAMKPPKFSLN